MALGESLRIPLLPCRFSLMRIALFITCFNDTLFPESGKATVRLLERLGHSVEFRREQACCGQMHVNSGYQREAVLLARLGQWPLAREGQITWLPGLLGGWTAMRDMPAVPDETFRTWWARRDKV